MLFDLRTEQTIIKIELFYGYYRVERREKPMQPRISVRKGKVSDDTKDHIEKACVKFDQYFDRIVDCEVIVDQQKQGHEVEFIVKVPHQTLTASVTNDNLYKAVDEVQGKIATQLKKYHDKLVAHR